MAMAPPKADLSGLAADLQAIADSESDNFLCLVAAAGLDPARDFIDADLRGTDLRNLDLRAFDFTAANLSGADTRGGRIQ